MRLFVLADIHANVAALEAVLSRLPLEAPDSVVCLGDTVGYNAEPTDALRLMREHCDVVIEGNHDHDSRAQDVHPTTGRSARVAIEYTRQALGDADAGYLRSLPHIHIQPEYVAAHGCYLNERHITGYVTSTMLERNLQRIEADPRWPGLALCGHTHVPMLGFRTGDAIHEPAALGEVSWPADATSVLINPGSVGQPRDLRCEAAYCVVDLEARRVRFERIAYDVERTIEANRRAGLPAELGERLREGR